MVAKANKQQISGIPNWGKVARRRLHPASSLKPSDSPALPSHANDQKNRTSWNWHEPRHDGLSEGMPTFNFGLGSLPLANRFIHKNGGSCPCPALIAYVSVRNLKPLRHQLQALIEQISGISGTNALSYL
jgi:hypothetical protein